MVTARARREHVCGGCDPAADALYAAVYVAGHGGDELPSDISDETRAWIEQHRAEFRRMVKTWR